MFVLLFVFILGGTIKNAIVACCCSKKTTKVGVKKPLDPNLDESIQSSNFTDNIDYELKLESIIEEDEHKVIEGDTRDVSYQRG